MAGRHGRRGALSVLAWLALPLAWGTAAAAGRETVTFDQLAQGYVEAYLAVHPVRATQLGVHDHDARLPDLSAAARRRRVRDLRGWLARLERQARAAPGTPEAIDRRILEHAIRSELLELQEVRGWERDPMLYTRLMADGAASLVERQFAPLEQRIETLIHRLEGYPALIGTARANLRRVPAPWTELALRSARGLVEFLRHDVAVAIAEQGFERLPPPLRARWALARRSAEEHVAGFASWLERDLAPRSNGDFRLGRERFARKLLYEEHVSASLEELVGMNERAIRDYREWIAREAARLDPTRPVEEVVRRVAQEHPSPDELVAAARRDVERARVFVEARQLLTLPTRDLPIVRPTPGYARAGFASMSAPGPFEDGSGEAYFNVTNVDPAWSEEQQREHMTYFNNAGLLGIAVHEVMPGHFVQLLYQRRAPTDLRKIFAPGTLVEGWAHYVEQMMVDEGLGDGDPAIRLGQLRRALQRHARWYATIALHTTDAGLEEVARRFAEIAHFAPFPARREALRATHDPTYLSYALGRMQILELREACRREAEARGDPFTLGDFHDRFLRLGLPAPLARSLLLADRPRS
jgi:uncharacterized protein (DUF885 family)